ncbi:hypothetical protein HHI36_004442 [Cryptolaemus montrouzieri]|uniref:DUF4774 domain-containing protein n=1 Tax=Cryptolaemus montrouzieri TaxID=559131 RepID=A0ABD2NRP2_9CUCU
MCSAIYILLPFGGAVPTWTASDLYQPLLNPSRNFYDLFLDTKIGDGSSSEHPFNSKNIKVVATSTTPSIKGATDRHDLSEQITMKNNEDGKMANAINNIIDEITKDSLKNIQSSPDNSLAPYRYHPLLNFLKQRINLDKNKIIEVRTDRLKEENATTTLILKPVARSVAGVDGKAISNPVSRAALRKGANVDILFEPDAIAIAGPGGIAHAESDLEIYYEDDDTDSESKSET